MYILWKIFDINTIPQFRGSPSQNRFFEQLICKFSERKMRFFIAIVAVALVVCAVTKQVGANLPHGGLQVMFALPTQSWCNDCPRSPRVFPASPSNFVNFQFFTSWIPITFRHHYISQAWAERKQPSHHTRSSIAKCSFCIRWINRMLCSFLFILWEKQKAFKIKMILTIWYNLNALADTRACRGQRSISRFGRTKKTNKELGVEVKLLRKQIQFTMRV